jgi:hypothetical protein
MCNESLVVKLIRMNYQYNQTHHAAIRLSDTSTDPLPEYIAHSNERDIGPIKGRFVTEEFTSQIKLHD